MPLLQITEPHQPLQSKKAVAIDLGTTHSLLAWVEDEKPRTLMIGDSPIVPSVIYVDSGGEFYVGQEAKKRASLDSSYDKLLSSFKRLFGKKLSQACELAFSHELAEKEGQLVVVVDDAYYAPRLLASHILHFLTQAFEKQIGASIATLVITVPAYFDDIERADVLAAAKAIGFQQVNLLSEPTAAAIAYGLQKEMDGCIMVYDLGGGTFDVSLLDMNDDSYRVKAVGGDTQLGGDDIDALLGQHLAISFAYDWNQIHADKRAEMMRLARQAKEHLSSNTEVELNCDGKSTIVTRTLFDQLTASIIQKTIDLCELALRDAEYSTSDLDAIVLVGGSSRIPAIANSLQAKFGIKPLMTLNPDEVVALGAAIHAQELQTQEYGLLLLDVTPLSLGLETMGGLMEVVIPRNSSIPIVKRQEFTTYKSGQVSMSISVYQGERSEVKHNRFLGRFVIKDIPAMPIGAARIAVDFALDANGVLIVSAQEVTQGKKMSIKLQPAENISSETITEILTQSNLHFADDVQKRLLVEACYQAEQILDMMNTALEQDGSLLAADEFALIEQEMVHLKQLVGANKNTEAIRKQMEALDKRASHFMQLRMDKALAHSIAGTSIADY